MAARENNDVIAEYRRNFYNVYHKSIIPILSEFEKKRKFELLKFDAAILISIAGCWYGFKLYFDNSQVMFLGLCLCILCGVCLILLPIQISNQFRKLLKESCMSKILSAFGQISWVPNENIINDNKLGRSDLFAVYNRRNTDDAFKGRYKDVDFKISETYMYYESGSSKNKIIRTVFRGVVIDFASNKIIKNKTIIATRGDMDIKKRDMSVFLVLFLLCSQLFANKVFNVWPYVIVAAVVLVVYIVTKLIASKDKETLNEIKLEDPEFGKKYKAYSSDEVEGRYLITPAFMERFNNIKTAFGAKKVKCSFYDKYLMFAISTNKNLFEIGSLFTRIDNPKNMEEFFKELTSILVLIDYFKLDEKTRI